jgi:hypothetical protein
VKKAFFAILTSMFVFVMTAVPSNAQVTPSAGDCATVETIIETIKGALSERGGKFEILNTDEVRSYIQNGIDAFGAEPPYAINGILIVDFDPTGDMVNVGYFGDGGCYLTKSTLPRDLVFQILLKRNPT